jgi:hypothetical protein
MAADGGAGAPAPPPAELHPSAVQALAIYHAMLLIRRFEERVAECFAAGKIPGFIHLSVGQEAIPAPCAACSSTLSVSVRKPGRVVVIHEAWAPCGIGAEVTAVPAEHEFAALKGPIRRLTPPFTPAPFSPPLKRAWLPTAECIVTAVRECVG